MSLKRLPLVAVTEYLVFLTLFVHDLWLPKYKAPFRTPSWKP